MWLRSIYTNKSKFKGYRWCLALLKVIHAIMQIFRLGLYMQEKKTLYIISNFKNKFKLDFFVQQIGKKKSICY